MSDTFGKEFLRELESEVSATRKCLERMKDDLFKYKPHEKSMEMGYLAIIVADVPKWITTIIEKGEIDFATWEKYKLTTVDELLKYYEENIEGAKKALSKATDKELEDLFYLKMGGQELSKDTKKNSVSSSINHWVHHRGQLTVYMRLNDIPVPSIYGPSADDKTF